MATSVEVVVSVTKTVVEHELSASSSATARLLNPNIIERRIVDGYCRHLVWSCSGLRTL